MKTSRIRIGTTLTLVLMILMGASAQAHPKHHGHFDAHLNSEKHEHGLKMLSRMLDRVDASPEQRSKINSFFKAAHADNDGVRNEINAARQKMQGLMSAATLDKSAIEQQREVMKGLHEKRAQRLHQAMLDSAEVLTPEQRSKLGQRMVGRSGQGAHGAGLAR